MRLQLKKWKVIMLPPLMLPVQVMMRNTKKVAQGMRLVEWNHKNNEKLAQEAKDQESEPKLSHAYSIGVAIAVGVLGLLGYYIYQRNKDATKVTPAEVQPQK